MHGYGDERPFGSFRGYRMFGNGACVIFSNWSDFEYGDWVVEHPGIWTKLI